MTSSFYARVDSNSANNPALNLTGDPAVELTFVASLPDGNLILDPNGGAPDSDTLVEIGGATYNFTYEFTGTMPTQNKHGAQQVPDQYEGSDVILVTVQDYPEAGDETRFAFLPNAGASQGDMDAFGNGAIDIQTLDETPPPTPVCFVAGSLIATPWGERRVETLKVGDIVLTASGEEVELKWVASSHFSYAQMMAAPSLRPICIPRGLFGNRMPHEDLWVSPQHRIVVRGWKAQLYLGAEAAFVAAKHLTGEPGRPGARWFKGVEYFHLLFANHQVLVSNGLESESFFPGEEAMKSVGPDARQALDALRRKDPMFWFGMKQTALPTATANEASAMGFAPAPSMKVA
ncbi:hypothetical protein C6W92_16065 [Roseovarius sp. A46]|uniref:Hint domain-containing protein n=1 Tax=Roseovarius sp. A46 TaxID=2109331 RepID=UPI0010130F91|nr:Hint domain-containing protein [Roseovarius sp. A46]RXV58875.1 hypothetical protein C6W92_16065 [Roseovarius sp. A46]